ncbi:MAG: hypothetical protein ABIH83_04880 [Candidatus Micrarchaeota archaeon]
MGKNYDFVNGIKFCWEKFRNRELLKWSAISTAVYFAASILDAILGIIILASVYALVIGGRPPPGFEMNLGIITMLVGLYLVTRLKMAAMAASSIKTLSKPPSVIEWAKLNLRRFLVDLFCWYDKRLLLPAIVFAIVGIISLAAGIIYGMPVLLFAAALCITVAFIAWGLGFVVHEIRTMFSLYMFLRGDGPEHLMVRKSFDVVKGQTISVFLPFLFFGIVSLLLMIIVAIVMIGIALVPCVGIIIDILLVIALVIAYVAFNEAFEANVFNFFCGKPVRVVEVSQAKKAKKRKKRKGK